MKKKLFFLILTIVAIFTLAACSSNNSNTVQTTEKKEETTTSETQTENSNIDGETIKAIKEKGKIVMGTSADFPPYEFKAIINGKEEIVGFDIAIAKKIAEKLGVELVIEDMDFSLLIGTLKQGQIDMIVAGLSYTEERATQIGMSIPYYDGIQTILIREEDKEKFNSIESLKGAVLGVQMGSIQADLAKTVEGATVKELPIIPSLLVDLKTKKIDAIVLEQPVAKQYDKNNEDLIMPENVVFENSSKGTVIGVNIESTDLLEFINATLEEMKNDGTIDKFVVEATELSNEQGQ